MKGKEEKDSDWAFNVVTLSRFDFWSSLFARSSYCNSRSGWLGVANVLAVVPNEKIRKERIPTGPSKLLSSASCSLTHRSVACRSKSGVLI